MVKMKRIRKKIKCRVTKLIRRFNYRASFFLFLRKINNKSSFVKDFFPLLFLQLFPRFRDGYTALIKIYGKKFYVRDLTDILVIKETFHDQAYESLFCNLDMPTTFIDIGSYIGDATIYAQDFPLVEKIIAIEPDPRNVKILKKNLPLNKVKNVIFIEAAISGKKGYSILYLYTKHLATSLLKLKNVKEKVKVQTVSLVEILRKVKTPNVVIKSDCEGAEYDFIMNTSPSTLSKINRFIFEYHMSRRKLNEIIFHLKKAGFNTTYNDLVLEPNVGMAYVTKNL